MRGRLFSQCHTEEERPGGQPFRALQTAPEAGHHEDEGWRLRKDGSRFAAHVMIEAITDEADQVVGYAKITRDITSKHKAAQKLRDSETPYPVPLKTITYHTISTHPPSRIPPP